MFGIWWVNFRGAYVEYVCVHARNSISVPIAVVSNRLVYFYASLVSFFCVYAIFYFNKKVIIEIPVC